jgi:hypothetical protein
MPQMWKVRLEWDTNEDPPSTDTLTFVSEDADTLSEIFSAINNDIVPTLGENLTIRATRLGELRGTVG